MLAGSFSRNTGKPGSPGEALQRIWGQITVEAVAPQVAGGELWKCYAVILLLS